MKKTLTFLLLALASFMLVPNVAQAQLFDRGEVRHQRPQRPPRVQPPRPAVPELSVEAAPAAALLIGGGLLVMAGRRRRQSEATQ